jgi:ferredoxin/flavodoxin
MVEVKKVQSLYFSPTGNTKKVIEAISRGINLPSAKAIDLTHPKQRDAWSGEFEADLLLVGVPVYGSTYPSIMLPSLKKLKGDGRFAVPIAVCGNCKMGTALAELSGILKRQGFTIPAAGNFIGEHSFATEDYRLGTGRPDAEDLRKALDFGKKIAFKVRTEPSDITSVYGSNLHIQCYVFGSLEAQGYKNDYRSLKPGQSDARVIVTRTDMNQCINCMVCVESCPTGAINPNTIEIDDLACLRCFQCTRICPPNILQKQMVPLPDLGAWWKIQEKRRGEPLTFI